MAAQKINLLDADPDLLDGLDSSAAAEARASVRVSVQTIERGGWRPKRDELESSGGLGLLVLDGFAARRLALGERWCAELLGQGCLLQPSLADAEFALSPSRPASPSSSEWTSRFSTEASSRPSAAGPESSESSSSARASARATSPAT